MSQSSYAPFLSYGTPGTHFFDKIQFFLDISNKWIKLWSKMVFLTFRSDRLLQNYEITLKVSGNPESASKFLILASNLDYLMIILGPKMGTIVHKKCQGFQKYHKT